MPKVLITGANRGLGLEFVKQYAEEGWQVHACCRHPEEAETLKSLVEEHHNAVEIHKLDVSDFSAIENLAENAMSGVTIDVLINNAGVYGGHENKLGDVNYDEWLKTFRVNTLAPLKMAESFVKHLEKSEQKKIISISSKMGSIADNTSGNSYIYRSSKTALNMVMKNLAIDLQRKGMTVAVLHPGWVLTDMGGPNALIKPEESVHGMRKVIAELQKEDSGKFFDYKGEIVPW